jgi:predicted DNA-binding ribbon-helix-helix protein
MQKPRIKRATTLKSQVVKWSITLARHKTSVSLERAFWDALQEIAAARNVSLYAMIAEIVRGQVNRSSALRVFVLQFYRDQRGAR